MTESLPPTSLVAIHGHSGVPVSAPDRQVSETDLNSDARPETVDPEALEPSVEHSSIASEERNGNQAGETSDVGTFLQEARLEGLT